MDPEIIKFYKDNGYNFSDFFDTKRHGGVKLTEAQIKAGARDYYNAIQSGEVNPKRISIGWGVIEWSKHARFDDFVKDDEILRRYKPIVQGLEDGMGVLKERIYAWKVYFWCMFVIAVFLGFAYADIKFGLGVGL